MSIILIPHDTRPHTLDLPLQLAKIMDIRAIVPPPQALSNFNTPGDLKALASWLNDVVKTSYPAALVVNLESLTLGGMIPARRVDTTEADVMEHLKILEEIHKNHPEIKIFAHSIITRVPDSDPYEEKEEVAKLSTQFQKYSELIDKVARGDSASKDELTKVTESIPKDVLEKYMNVRKRNLALNLKAIDYLNIGVISYLALTLDNTSFYSMAALDQRVLETKLDDLNLWQKANIYPGADEVPCELLAKSALELAGKIVPKAHFIYNSKAAPQSSLLYEDRPLGEVVSSHQRAIGIQEVNSIKGADLIIAINGPGKKQAESSTQPNLENVENSHRYLADFVDKIDSAIATWKPVVVIDVSYANGCDDRFMKLFLHKCDITKVAGLSGWDTAGNSVGSGLSMGIAYLLRKNHPAWRDMLFTRFADDWVYQCKLRKELYAKLENPDIYNLGEKRDLAQKTLQEMMGPELESVWRDYFEKGWNDCDLKYNGATLPWPRLFCIRLDAQVVKRPNPEDEELEEEKIIKEKSNKRPMVKLPEVEQSLGETVNVEADIKAVAENKEAPSTGSIFASILQKVFLDSIKKIVASNQLEEAKSFVVPESTGKTTWCNTHFIYMLDCSGSMRGTRWESVMIGYKTFLNKVKNMKNITITTFTFDTRVNPFGKEESVEKALEEADKIPFSGKGTNYSRAMKHAIEIFDKSETKDNLVCIMFLSDGLGGYPDEAIETLMKMREDGRRFVFYSIGCATDEKEDEDMIGMATSLGGEHYRVIDAEAARIVFPAILNI